MPIGILLIKACNILANISISKLFVIKDTYKPIIIKSFIICGSAEVNAVDIIDDAKHVIIGCNKKVKRFQNNGYINSILLLLYIVKLRYLLGDIPYSFLKAR